jgi:flavin reductase (DIM6/NTAB) family NADH-FMN oxidoreductase RutF
VCPRIPGAAGFLARAVAQLVAGGDHVILLGEVVTARPSHGRPLTYQNRAFGTHPPHRFHAV